MRSGIAAILLLCSLPAFAQSREELLATPKVVEGKAPRFQTFTPDAVRDAVRVFSRRSYAAFGFNDPAVTVRLPSATNSIYATFTFDEPKLTDARGRSVAYELEQGIFDFDTSSNEIRMKPKSGKGVVDFAHAVGKVTVKYPLSVKTVSIRKGADKNITIDGPFVATNKSAVELPEVASFSKVEPLRAYDASGRQLERAGFVNSYIVGDQMWRKLGFWGNVAEVRIDRVEKWTELAIDYDLPPAAKLPDSQQGSEPPLEERLKASDTPGGRVTKSIKGAAAVENPSPASGGSAEEEPAAARRSPALVMKAAEGDAEEVRRLLDSGTPIDGRDESGDMTALIAAIRFDHQDLAMTLIRRGADVNLRDQNGGTALIFAAQKCGWTPVVRRLLKHGAKTSPKTKGGVNALQFAESMKCSVNADLIRGK